MWREIIVGSSPTWGTMKRIIVRYKDKSFKVNISEDNTCIINSCTVRKIKDMKAILSEISKEAYNSCGVSGIHRRTMFSLINEWRVRNLLYELNIERDRTESVDLDVDQPWYMKVLYTVISPFYPYY